MAHPLHAGSGSGAPTGRLPGDEDAIMRDPAVATVGSAGGGLCMLNDGRVFIQLKPHREREPIDKVIARLRTNLARIQGITLYMSERFHQPADVPAIERRRRFRRGRRTLWVDQESGGRDRRRGRGGCPTARLFR
jgi:hypothetical protein